MKETIINGKDYGFIKPWNIPVDITQPDSQEKIKELGNLSRDEKLQSDFQEMTNEEFAQFCFEMRLALYQEEIRRFGEYETRPNMSNNY